MGGMSVHYQEDGTPGIVDQSLEELKEALAVHPPIDHHEAQRTLSADRRDHVQAETTACTLHDRRLSDRCPGAAAVVVGADARFVAEEDLSPFLPGQLLDGRELHLPPARYSGFWGLRPMRRSNRPTALSLRLTCHSRQISS